MTETHTLVDPAEVLSALKRVLPESKRPIPLHEPLFVGNEWHYAKECLDSAWVSVGSYVSKFEKHLSEFTGIKGAVAVVNGTSALHIALRLAGVQLNDEVLVPALSFVAPANAVTYCGAIPHFVDSDEETLGVSVSKLASWLNEISVIRDGQCFNRLTNRPIKALLAVHVLGHPCDLDGLVEICVRHRIELIEDAAEAIGSLYKGKHVGAWGKVSVLSFNGNKTVTTGGGGAILTSDEKLAAKAKHLTTTAKVPHAWNFEHDEVGYNYRLANINAAIGCAQLEALPEMLRRKRSLASRYREAFSHVSGIRFFDEPEFARSNYWLDAIVLDHDGEGVRDAILEKTHAEGILTRPLWSLIHRFQMFQACPRMDLSTAESLERRVINIPSSPSL